MKRKISAATIALTAILTAFELVFVFAPIPPVAGASLAFCLIPVFIAATTGKKGMTAFLSVLMALGMLTAAYTVRAASLTAPVFQNPLVAVPPRLMVGVTAFASYNGLMSVAEKKFDPLLAVCEKGSEEYKKLSRKKGAATYGIAAFTAFIGTVTNTGLVCLMIWLCYMVGDMYIASDILPQFFQVTLAVNASIEVAAFTILLPPVVMALSRAGYCRGGKKKR